MSPASLSAQVQALRSKALAAIAKPDLIIGRQPEIDALLTFTAETSLEEAHDALSEAAGILRSDGRNQVNEADCFYASQNGYRLIDAANALASLADEALTQAARNQIADGPAATLRAPASTVMAEAA